MTDIASPAAAAARRPFARLAAVATRDALSLVVTTAAYLAVASLAALLMVRVGADLLQGIDPLASEARRPRLYPQQLALRELWLDIVRQALLAALVIAAAKWRDGAAWTRTLALSPPAAPGLPVARLLLILLLWPALHIAWVTGTAEVFGAAFGRNVRISPALSERGIVAWVAYVGLLAPVAEELLMRGAMFDRARRFLRPWGAILVTALLFSLAHLTPAGLARPVSLLPLAVMLGWLRWRTGRLWPCILLHGWSNLAMVAYVLWPEPA